MTTVTTEESIFVCFFNNKGIIKKKRVLVDILTTCTLEQATTVRMKSLPIIPGLLLAALLTGCKGNVTTTQLEIYRDSKFKDHKCPTWFIPSSNNTGCECGADLSGIKCKRNSKEVWLYVLACMTYDNATKNTLVGRCPFSDLQKPSLENDYVLVPNDTSELNEFMCGKMNRVGRMCHKCKPGFGPAVLSYEVKCLKCFNASYGWLLYLLLACLPTTLLFFITIIFQGNIASASLNAFVFYVQCIYFGTVPYPRTFIGAAGISYPSILAFVMFGGFWNLDSFPFIIPQFCISDRLTNLHVLTMEYLVAFFPLFLTALTYIIIQIHARDCTILVVLWRPFSVWFAPLVRRYQWNPAESLVHVFVTFLILSYSKLLFVSFTLLRYTPIQNSRGALVAPRVLYYDASVTFLSREHLSFALLAIFVLFTFNILPLLVVVLYPTRVFQKCLNCFRIRWLAVHAFADAFNGCYKDGTNGTWDYRYFAGFYLLGRIVFLFNNEHITSLHYYAACYTVGILLFVFCRPYKKNLFNILDSFFFLFVILMYVHDYRGIALAVVLMFYFMVYILSKILLKVQCRCFLKLKSFVDRITVEQKVQTNRGDGEGGDLPDRLVNPERYRLLSEPAAQRGDQNSCDYTRPVATYGIV